MAEKSVSREKVRPILEFVAYGVGSRTMEELAQSILDEWREENLEPATPGGRGYTMDGDEW